MRWKQSTFFGQERQRLEFKIKIQVKHWPEFSCFSVMQLVIGTTFTTQTNFVDKILMFFYFPSHPYLTSFAFVVTCLSGGETRRATLLLVVLTALKAAVVAAAIRRGEVRVPQVIGQWALGTGIMKPLPLGLLHGNLWVSHPSPYLHVTKAGVISLCRSQVGHRTPNKHTPTLGQVRVSN